MILVEFSLNNESKIKNSKIKMAILPTKNELKFASLMSLVTTFFVTFVIVLVNVGFTEKFFIVWMRSWLIAFVLVGLSILYIAPIIRDYLMKK